MRSALENPFKVSICQTCSGRIIVPRSTTKATKRNPLAPSEGQWIHTELSEAVHIAVPRP